ncbi:hypothetical protein [Pseudovibrio sp. SPO723]|uniref:hypothetical protein n=1 Tax=Nesiotobacter zosterae TaxID=392721 RepID=UPI0029C9BE39|nr:hypothetical protein [Pseudovibrio sp. SPO723]
MITTIKKKLFSIKQNKQYQKPPTHHARGLFAFQNTQPTMHAAPRTNPQRQKHAVALA